jgi:hypothetical protein
MRKNPTPKEQLKDDLRVLGFSFSLYLISYWLGYHSLCILSMATMNIITFQAGITFHEAYSKPIHLNQFDELDTSMSSENSDTIDNPDELSLKQREQGASISRGMTAEQEERLYKQLNDVVEETRLRNRKRSALNTSHTPSSTTLVNDCDETQYPPIPQSDAEDEYHDMPALVSSDEQNPILYSKYEGSTPWSNVPNFSQTHYLHNYMEEVD